MATSPPMAMEACLLLAEFCPVKAPSSQINLNPKLLSDRATKITIVLKQILSPIGWHRGGINE